MKKRVCLYFGSFNPVHIGHRFLASYLVDSNKCDEVWFVVSPCNPLKRKDDLLDENLRLEMLMLTSNPKFKVSDIEFLMPIPSYTIDTLNELTSLYKEIDFTLVIGTDNALVFDKWKLFGEILEKYKILVYPRLGYDFSEVKEQYPQMIYLEDAKYVDISSTQIRQLIKDDGNYEELLEPFVYNYIKKNNLYK